MQGINFFIDITNQLFDIYALREVGEIGPKSVDEFL